MQAIFEEIKLWYAAGLKLQQGYKSCSDYRTNRFFYTKKQKKKHTTGSKNAIKFLRANFCRDRNTFRSTASTAEILHESHHSTTGMHHTQLFHCGAKVKTKAFRCKHLLRGPVCSIKLQDTLTVLFFTVNTTSLELDSFKDNSNHFLRIASVNSGVVLVLRAFAFICWQN